jgi:hypothetical protein
MTWTEKVWNLSTLLELFSDFFVDFTRKYLIDNHLPEKYLKIKYHE